MVEGGKGPFDLMFIDAAKGSYPEYLKWAMRLSRSGLLIPADNTVRGGSVMEPEDELARTIQKCNEMLAKGPRLSTLILPLIREIVNGPL